MGNLIRKGIEFYQPSQDLLHYEPDTGILRWAVDVPYSRRKKGMVAGGITNKGYIHIRVKGTKLLAHRIAWFLTYGVVPDHIDHINGDKTDNRLANLRSCTAAENAGNTRRLRGDNTSGCRGVSWFKPNQKWGATIQHKRVSRFLGLFDTFEEAVDARRQAELDVYGEFAPHTEN